MACCCCSVSKSCPTLCDTINSSMQIFPVLHYLQELAQTYVHWVGDANQAFHSHCPLLLLPSVFPIIRVFSNELELHQSFGASHLVSVLPMDIQGWFLLGLTGLISLLSKGLSRVFSNTTVQSISCLVISLLYGPTLTSIHDYWKKQSLDYTDLCWQSDVSAF